MRARRLSAAAAAAQDGEAEAAKEAMELMRIQQRQARQKLLLLPTSTFVTVWAGWIIGPLVVYTCIAVPLDVSFNFVTYMAADDLTAMFIVDRVVDVCFAIDIAINFRTAFYSAENELVLDGKQSARQYSLSWFPIDLISTIPFEIFAGDNGAAIGILKLPRLLRLGRLLKRLDRLRAANIIRVLKLIFVFLLLAHWVACIWWALGVGDFNLQAPFGASWILRVPSLAHPEPLYPSVAVAAGLNATAPYRADNLQQYITSLYWSLTMLMKTPVVGPDTLVEKIFSCFLVLLGAFVFAVLLGNITAMIAVFDRKNAMFRDRVGEIDRFAASRSLPNSLHKKVLRHFREHWSLTIGLETSDLIKHMKLPTALGNQLLRAIHSDLVDASPVLRACPSPLLVEALRRLQPFVCLQKEFLLKGCDVCRGVYILQKGSLQASRQDGGAPRPSMVPGASPLGRQNTSPLSRSAEGSPSPKRGSTRASTWKAKLQVRMIESDGSIVGFASPYDAPAPLPFSITAMTKTDLHFVSREHLLGLLDLCSAEEAERLLGAISDGHTSILDSLKARGTSLRHTDANSSRDLADEISARAAEEPSGPPDSPDAKGKAHRTDEKVMRALEREVANTARAMASLRDQAALIPRLAEALARKQGVPVPPEVVAALEPGGVSSPPSPPSPTDDLERLHREVLSVGAP